jgi:hypothetical protein
VPQFQDASHFRKRVRAICTFVAWLSNLGMGGALVVLHNAPL